MDQPFGSKMPQTRSKEIQNATNEPKRVWFVNIQQIYQGYFFVTASSSELARRLAWAHYEKGNEPKGIGSHPGYLVEAIEEKEPQMIVAEEDIDVDEDNPEYAMLDEVP